METGGFALRVVIELVLIPPAVILLARKRWRAEFADLGIIRPSRQAWLWFTRFALVLALLWLAIGVVLLAVLRGRIDIAYYHFSERRALLLRDGVFWAGFCAFIRAPVVEELLHRGVLYRPLRNRLGARWAILASALIFSATHVHYMGELRLPYQQFAGGLIAAWAYEKTGSLVFPIVVHFIQNAAATTWILLAAYRPEWLQTILG